MARDALETEVDPVTGEVTFPNLPRLPDGSPDWARLGGETRFYARERDERGRRKGRKKHLIDPKPSIPHPETGEPVRPE